MRCGRGSAELCGAQFQPSRVSSVRPNGNKYHGSSSRRLHPFYRSHLAMMLFVSSRAGFSEFDEADPPVLVDGSTRIQ